jgi:hypothetical protein
MRKDNAMRLVGFVLALGVAACAANGEPWQGEHLEDRLTLATPDEGMYPDRSVLADPVNPFGLGALADTTVWQVQSNGGAVAAFYAWATLLARGPNGERQYYVALDLKAVYELSEAAEDQLPGIRDRAIRGFQLVLDKFPTAVTYDATGTITYDLATPSVEAILALGGKVQGGWVIVSTADGGRMAVRK